LRQLDVNCFVKILDSIEENTKVLLKPTLKYENYQLFCLDTNQLAMYDSSFDGESSKSFTSTVLVGNDNNNFAVSIYVPTAVYSCTLLTYNKILLNVIFYIKFKE
jgi:hypothetical protein